MKLTVFVGRTSQSSQSILYIRREGEPDDSSPASVQVQVPTDIAWEIKLGIDVVNHARSLKD
jgi:hypothetical protein